MVHMVFRDVFDLHEQYSAFSYGQLPETSCKILSLSCYSLFFVFTYLSLIQLQHVAVALPIYVIVECNIKPFLFIFILAICEKEQWSSLIYC